MGGRASAPTFRERLVRDWYLPRLTLLTALLLPLSWLFRGIAAMRRRLYRMHLLRSATLPVPVIIIGNITAGGTGKTPLVAWLAGRLVRAGRRPGIVSRGHGGSNEVPRAVRAGDDALAVGDEPLLLARTGVPVWIGANRVAAARRLLAAHPDLDVVISDDGLQHYRLARAVEIVVVDGARGFGNGRLLPAGPLREPVARSAAADAIVINGPSSAPSATADVPRFALRLAGETFRRLIDPAQTARAGDFAGKRIHAIAGIGNPERFFASLRALGLNPACHAFPDHHAYRAADLAFPDADYILMTDKDAIKCTTLADSRMWTLPVTAEVDDGLIERILEKLNGRQAA
ncbi:MAG: tetraacyldisaccharide 4'-kinase [Betaproteobacteria bacterium]